MYKLIKMHTCKHIVSQTAVDPQFPSSPSSTNLETRSLKYMSQTFLFILIESAKGCRTCLWVRNRIKMAENKGKWKTTSNYVNKNLTAQRETESQECSQGYPLRKISLIITNKREDLSLHQFCNLNILWTQLVWNL